MCPASWCIDDFFLRDSGQVSWTMPFPPNLILNFKNIYSSQLQLSHFADCPLLKHLDRSLPRRCWGCQIHWHLSHVNFLASVHVGLWKGMVLWCHCATSSAIKLKETCSTDWLRGRFSCGNFRGSPGNAAIVTFLGWWISDPFKGCWWPLGISKGHGLNHLDVMFFFVFASYILSTSKQFFRSCSKEDSLDLCSESSVFILSILPQ